MKHGGCGAARREYEYRTRTVPGSVLEYGLPYSSTVPYSYRRVLSLLEFWYAVVRYLRDVPYRRQAGSTTISIWAVMMRGPQMRYPLMGIPS